MAENVLNTLGRTIFQLGYQISPIVLTGGVADLIPGGMLPIVAITEAPNFITGLLSGGTDLSLDNFFAHFKTVPGGSLIDVQLGKYPFGSQVIAANAIIAQPLQISLSMTCPVRNAGGYTAKLATMMALKAVLDNHANNGGTYIVVTPSYIYEDCVLLRLRDVSSGETKQPQVQWQFDFEKPLITLQDAENAQNSLISKLTAGLPTDGSLSGPASTAGNTLSGAAAVTAPVSTNLAGSSVLSAPLSPVTSVPL
jgi:hypothetical protein